MFPTRERLTRLVVLALFLIHLTQAAAAQSNPNATGSVHGVVSDPIGAAIAGAHVAITNLNTKSVRSVETGADGRYDATALSAGLYSVNVQFSGFKTTTREPINLASDQTVSVDFRLEMASMGGGEVHPSDNSLTDGRGTWDLGVFLGGGTGAGKSDNTQFLYAGGRGGLILSPDLFTSTPIRGNFEYAIEVMPVYTVFTPGGAVYGGSIKPIILQWNFTKPRTVVPYVHIAGGVLFTTSDVPPPDTSSINFTPQIGAGIHWFVRPTRSLDFQVDVVHHSNASLGDHNPGYNASVFFSVGYSWYKRHLW